MDVDNKNWKPVHSKQLEDFKGKAIEVTMTSPLVVTHTDF